MQADAGDKLKSGVEKLKDAVAGKLKEVQHDNLEAHKHTPNDEGFEWSPMEAEESPARKADKKRMMDLQKEQHGSAGD
jgi:acyl-CoA hydrolase